MENAPPDSTGRALTADFMHKKEQVIICIIIKEQVIICMIIRSI
jgi:hypothetical protein